MKKPSLLYSSISSTVRFLFKLLYRHKVYGVEHYPAGHGIVAPNHVSFLDPPCVAISCPGPVHFLARHSLFASHFGTLIAALHAHPVKENSSNLQVMKEICQLLSKGHKVLMFPEGTRSKDGKISAIKPGIGLLLSKSESVIIPTYVHGTFRIWSRTRKFPRLWGKTAVVFGSPIAWQDYAHMDRKQAQILIAQKLKGSLQNLQKWYTGGRRGTPP